MDNKQETSTNTETMETTESDKSHTVKEDSTVALPTKSTSTEETNNTNSPTGNKGPKKKSKGKGNKGNSVAGNDLDTELRKLTQRRINVAGAPKMPLNAYVRFMNDRREQLRREHPQRTALEHTKMIGEEWHLLTDNVKTPYMEAAAKDKALYQEQMHKFLKEHPEIIAAELAKGKKIFDSKNASTPKEKAPNSSNNDGTGGSSSTAAAKKPNAKTPLSKQLRAPTPDTDDMPLAQVKRTPTPPLSASTANTFSSCPLPRTFAAGEIPIYTNEFIEHNRSTENELRMLRKAKTDLEQQNAVLEQHVDNTKAGHAKVMGEVSELKDENARLLAYIKGLRQKLVSALVGLPLPPLEPNGINVDNVDKYIQHLSDLMSGQQNMPLLQKVGEILNKIDMATLPKP